jgi:hypothetical protein
MFSVRWPSTRQRRIVDRLAPVWAWIWAESTQGQTVESAGFDLKALFGVAVFIVVSLKMVKASF